MTEKRREEIIKISRQSEHNTPLNMYKTSDLKGNKHSVLSEELIVSLDEGKHNENTLENNTDSNKSSNFFQHPIKYNPSSSNSESKDVEYMTPKSIHNLNLLFTHSNGKKSQNQPRIIHSENLDSPIDNKMYMNYQSNFPISPIDPRKFNNKQSNMILNINSNANSYSKINSMNVFSRSGESHYIFNNEGRIPINYSKHFSDSKIIDKGSFNKKYIRKIEFNTDNMESYYKTKYYRRNIEEDIKNENYLSNIDNNKSVTESSSSEVNNENEIKKPQPIVANSVRRIQKFDSDPREKIYLPQFQAYSLSQIYSNNKEFQEINQQELEKKKFFCNCKRSKCLKLYCECFANGEYCITCNCLDCSNIIGNEEEKDEAFKLIKDKNPVAMKLNITKGPNKEETKIGCNCTKSNCSKKYCECYKLNVQCTEVCRCRECSNYSENKTRATIRKVSFQENQEICYNYDEFVIEKISIHIESSTIKIQKSRIDNLKFNNFILKGNINYSKKENSNSVVFKNINNSFFIEINKSYINYPYSQTPIINKFKKRRRNKSSDSFEKYDYHNQILNRTACESNKKSFSENMGINKVIGKKLNLDLIEDHNY